MGLSTVPCKGEKVAPCTPTLPFLLSRQKNNGVIYVQLITVSLRYNQSFFLWPLSVVEQQSPPKKRKTFIQFHTVRFLKRIEPKSWIDLLGPGDDSDVLIGGGAVCWRVVMKVTNKIWKSYI